MPSVIRVLCPPPPSSTSNTHTGTARPSPHPAPPRLVGRTCRFRLINYRQDMVLAFMRGGLLRPQLAALSAPIKVAHPNEPLQARLALTGDNTWVLKTHAAAAHVWAGRTRLRGCVLARRGRRGHALPAPLPECRGRHSWQPPRPAPAGRCWCSGPPSTPAGRWSKSARRPAATAAPSPPAATPTAARSCVVRPPPPLAGWTRGCSTSPSWRD